MVEYAHSARTHVLVVEDELKTAELIRLYLEQGGHRATVVHDGAKAIEVFRQVQPDLVVLDIMLPGTNGLDVCRVIRQDSDVPIIILTARSSESDTVAGLDLGADDYVVKPFSPRELMARLRALLRRSSTDSNGSDAVTRTRDIVVEPARRRVTVGDKEARLTRVEFEVLLKLIQQPGRVFTRAQLADAALGHDYEGFERSIDAHILRLRRKIEPDRNNPTYVRTVYGVGYKFAEDDR